MGTFCQLSSELWPLIDVRNLFLPSIFAKKFFRFSSNFVCELILGRCVLGLQMDTFRHLIDEVWPLIDVQKCISLNIF